MCSFLVSLLGCSLWIFLCVYIIFTITYDTTKVYEAMALPPSEAEPVPEVEQLGDFLLTTERLYDCFFVVGNTEPGPTSQERIGVVKVCLMNHSQVFRSMLHDSHLAERGDILVPDIQPPIFRLLLRHCYGGLENCQSITPEICVLLCYAAEKYMMTSLKRKLGIRLKPECTSEIFPALHCLVTYNVAELEHHIIEMIREQTDKIFSSEGFVDIDVNSLEFIVKQDVLNCSEIDIWRAVLKWATQKVQNEEGSSIRDWISQPLKHIRLMTLTYEDLCKEVLPTNVLTFDEFCQVCAKSDFVSDTICTKIEVRGVFQERWKWWETVTVAHEGQGKRWGESDKSNSCLVVGNRNIMLESITCMGSVSQDFFTSYGLSYPCQAELQVSRITDYISSSSTDEPVTIKYNGTANYFEQFTIPTLINGDSIVLRANSMYKLKLSFVSAELSVHPSWHAPACSDGHVFTHGKFYCSYIYEDGAGWKPSHIIKFQYSYRR